MVEETVANYIAAQTSLVKGTDLFLGELPDSVVEGVAVSIVDKFENHRTLTYSKVYVYVFKKDYTEARALIDELSALLNNYRGGYGGNWTIANPVELIRFGLDDLKRYVYALGLDVVYDESVV